MSKHNRLDYNNYLETERKSEFGMAAWVCWILALLLLLIPVRSSFLRIHTINAAQDSPALNGDVILLKRDPAHRQSPVYDTRVEIHYKGHDYTITEEGFCFTPGMYERAMESGAVPVYLNPDAPEKSVLSKGIPAREWILPSLFTLISLCLIGGGVYCRRRSR